MSRTILLLGSMGQVGWELQRSLSVLGRTVSVSRADCDLADEAAVRSLVRQVSPQAIVNAAAYTAVDAAEGDEAGAARVNAALPAILADEAARLDAWLLHYSTDYVFDGTRPGAYTETDEPNPLNVYGRTKLQGEHAVRAWSRHLVLRTSWVFGAHGGNFLKTMLRLGRERAELNVVDDQIGSPTSADLIADVSAHLLAALLDGRGRPGLYHLASGGHTSWCGYARFIMAEAQRLGLDLRCTPESVRAVPGSAYPTAARRPANSRLDTTRLSETFGLTLPDWQEQVSRILQEVS